MHGFILGMDTFALGLLNAAKLIEDNRLDAFVKERYASFNTGIGKKILDGTATLQELSEHACRLGQCEMPPSGNQEYLESVLNSVLFG